MHYCYYYYYYLIPANIEVRFRRFNKRFANNNELVISMNPFFKGW